MGAKRNHVEPAVTTVRSSYALPSWLHRQITEIALRTYSTRSQVVRRLLAEAVEREASKKAEAVA